MISFKNACASSKVSVASAPIFGIVEDPGIFAGQFPRHKKRRPVDGLLISSRSKSSKTFVPRKEGLITWRCRQSVRKPRRRASPMGRNFFRAWRAACSSRRRAYSVFICPASPALLPGVHHIPANPDAAGSVLDVNDQILIRRRDLDRRMVDGSRGPSDQKGRSKPCRSISLATLTISSRDGVISPLNPIMSAFSARAASRILAHGTITPRSMILKLLQARTTPTMFLPISCTSPLTVAMMIVPATGEASPLGGPSARLAPPDLPHGGFFLFR